MKELLVNVLFVSMISLTCGAEIPHYRAVYDFLYTRDSINSIKERDLLYLEISGEGSLCFSYYSYYTDSLMSTPNGRTIWRKQFSAAVSKDGANATAFPHKRSTFLVNKNFRNDTILIKDVIDDEIFEYETLKKEFNWTICDSTKSIAGYNSYQATCLYHGRKWVVWFSPEIPINDGPWVFSGLPGLILEANDSDNLYLFRLFELNTNDNIIHDWMDNGKKMERIDFLKKKNEFLKRINNFSKLAIGTKKSSGKDTRYLDGLETDYMLKGN